MEYVGVLTGTLSLLPLLWGILVVIRLGDIRKLLAKISEDIAVVRAVGDDARASRLDR